LRKEKVGGWVMYRHYYKQTLSYNLATIQFKALGYCLPHLIYQYPYARDGAKDLSATSSCRKVSSSSREAIGSVERWRENVGDT
jgi:hypothetical protein